MGVSKHVFATKAGQIGHWNAKIIQILGAVDTWSRDRMQRHGDVKY